MKTYKYSLFVIGILLLGVGVAKGQDSIRFIRENDTTVGIPITKAKFQNKVGKYLVLMSDWTKFTPEDYVEMVKLFNTIGDSNLIKKDYYRMYYQVFLVMYLKDVGKTLDTHLMKGMSMYSKKYNIWIGDRPYGNNNSMFKVDTTGR
jgi:hypothetical protein